MKSRAYVLKLYNNNILYMINNLVNNMKHHLIN